VSRGGIDDIGGFRDTTLPNYISEGMKKAL